MSTFTLEHRDAFEALAALSPASIDLSIFDPPYASLERHRLHPDGTPRGRVPRLTDWFPVIGNERLGELMQLVYRAMAKNSHCYVLVDAETLFELKPAGEAAGFKFWKPIVWDKCLAPETFVWTTRGVIPAQSVQPGDIVSTPDGRETRVKAVRETQAPTVKICLSNGTEITCSRDHRWLKKGGQLVEAGSLRMGDALQDSPPVLKEVSKFFEMDSVLEEDELVLEMPDTNCCLFCGRHFDGKRAAAAHQARFCEKAMSKKEMAERLGVKVKRLRRWLSTGRIPAKWAKTLGLVIFTTGRSRLYLQNDAELWFPEYLRLDHGWGRLIGLYASQGSRNEGATTFSFHERHTVLQDHVARMSRTLGLRSKVVPFAQHGKNVHVFSTVFSKLIESFVGGTHADTKFLKPTVFHAPEDFIRGVFDGLLEGDGHWSYDEQRETYVSASPDLSSFVLRYARFLGWHATIRRQENEKKGYWAIRFDPKSKESSVHVISVEAGVERRLIDISIEDASELFVLGNGLVTHNCSIGMGYHYRSRYEFVAFFEKGKRNLFDLGVPDVISAKRIRGKYATEKPSSLLEVFVLQSSHEGELVLDPFMGSGSTGEAAVKHGRRFHGIDVQEKSIELAIKRLEGLNQEVVAE